MSSLFAIIRPCVVALVGSVFGAVTLTAPVVTANPATESKTPTSVANVGQMWKENYTVEYTGALPVSVAFSVDGKTLLTGDTAGEVMALIVVDHEPQWRWKTKVDGSHAAVAFSADQKQIYSTTEHGVRILDAARGKEQGRIEAKDSSPTAIGVFPNKSIAEKFTRTQIVFGTPRGYFVKSWAEGKLPDSIGTIETSTVAKDAKPADEAAVPLAVDPQGRSAIMTGPMDQTGKAGGLKGKNVLWAYVCGDYEMGSPGNRVMPGHTATVVSAAWAKEGGTAITGDAAGRVIVWDAKTMKEIRRLELGGRVAALAISDDATRAAAYVLGKQGEVYVWDTAKPIDSTKPIHTELGNFAGPQTFASLSFAPNGQQLAGCAINKQWLGRLGELIGKVRVWELSAEPKAQLPPKQTYIKQLPKGSSPNLVVLNNDSLLAPAAEQGAVDFRSVADGKIQTRIVLGKIAIGRMRLSTDRKWLAIEQRQPANDSGGGDPNAECEVGVYEAPLVHKATIPSCSQLLDIASGGKVVAVVREKQIELWDIATTKKLKAAPFQHAQIDAASFSPDGQLLAISDRNELVLWRWEENTHERLNLGRSVGSLAFSPDGKFLAEGPAPGGNIQIRNVATRKVVQTVAETAERSMNVPRMAYTQGGRVLIACDNIRFAKEIAKPHVIELWDTTDGSLAHQLQIRAGLPQTLGVSPNGRYLIAMIEDSDGVKLSGWRLDGEEPVKESSPTPPAASSPR
jgi:WD40 repeat protein